MSRLCIWFTIVFAILSVQANGSVYYVKIDGDNLSLGTSWETAKRTIGSALVLADSGDEIWVAAGTYEGDFTPKPNVFVYGGFKGTETLREQRSPSVNSTFCNGTIKANCSGIYFRDYTSNGTASKEEFVGRTITTSTKSDGGPSISIDTSYAPSYTYDDYVYLYVVTSLDVVGVTWSNDQGGDGECGQWDDGKWCSDYIPLSMGDNKITFTATDGDGKTATCSHTIARREYPIVTIETPTEDDIYMSSTPEIELTGTIENYFDSLTIYCQTNYDWMICDGGESWSVDCSLVEGLNEITVIASDEEFWLSTDTIKVIYNDTEPPVIDMSNEDTYVNQRTVQLSGCVSDNALVKSLTWSSNRGGSGTLDPGCWYVDVPLSVGLNVITFTAADYSGNTSSKSINVYCDLTTPQITITTPTDQPVYTCSEPVLTLAGTASDDSGCFKVTCITENSFTPAVTGRGSWSTSVALWPGDNLIMMVAEDAAGNTANATLTVTCDVGVDPVITILEPTSQPTFDSDCPDISLIGSVFGISDTATIEVISDRQDGGEAMRISSSEWIYYGSLLKIGKNVITVSVKEDGEVVATDSITVEYQDKTAPDIFVSSPWVSYDGVYCTNADSVDIIVGASDDVDYVSSVTWKSDHGSDGDCINYYDCYWLAESVPLEPGLSSIKFTAVDNYGNEASTFFKAYRDIYPPVIKVRDGQPAETATSPVTIILDVTDDYLVQNVYWSNTENYYYYGYCYQEDDHWCALVELTGGRNNLTFTAYDAAGNVSETTYTIDFVDDTPPVITIISPDPATPNYTNASFCYLWGSLSDEGGISDVRCSTDYYPDLNWYCYADSWYWDVYDLPLEIGKNAVTVTASDICGNKACASTSVTRVESSQAGSWHGMAMVTVPVDPIYCYGDPSCLIGFSSNKWATYDPVNNRYIQYPDEATYLGADSIGRGFWVYLDEYSVDSNWPYLVGWMVDQNAEQKISLKKGWNLIGSPFALPVTLDKNAIKVIWPDNSIKTLGESSDIVRTYLWGWQTDDENPKTGEYYLVGDASDYPDACDQLEPWMGYWIKADQACTLVLPPPASE